MDGQASHYIKVAVSLGESQTLIIDVLDKKEIQIVPNLYGEGLLATKTANSLHPKHRGNRVTYF